MSELKDLIKQIKETRCLINKIVIEKEKLLDAEVLALSRKMDEQLNAYGRLLRKNDDKCFLK